MILEQLVRRADGVVISSLPATIDRLGLGREQMAVWNSELVYCHIVGRTEGSKVLPSHDLDVLAGSGAFFFGPAKGSFPLGLPIADLATGALAALGMLGALLNGGRAGVRIEVSMEAVMETWMALAGGFATAADAEGFVSGVPSIGGYGCFTGGDGVEFTIGGVEDRFWTEIAQELAIDEDPYLSLAARKTRADELNRHLDVQAKARSAKDWVQRLRRRGVPCSLVRTPAEVIAAAVPDHEASIHVGDGGTITLGLPGFAGAERLGRAPAIGEHTTLILSWLGLSAREAALRQELAVL
jgi:crotonobetainyl-CoA:carnitine CoA-transferase CaiB-like acyl-CoA transferase